nr:hypothetical protein BaRGS_032488 [Batillaria attramentaria]
MLSHDENKALSACKLQDRITGILQANPDLAEAHFLSYLNSLRVKEYCTAVHNLHHYFDRNSHLTGETTGGNKKLEEEVSRRYAALNLAALHFQFGHNVFDYLMKSSVINCQHSLYAMMSISGVQRSALWSYYGNRECAAMCAQIVLCLDTAEGGIFYNGESVCMALCLLARHHFDRGAHSCATEILQHARQRTERVGT